MSAVAAEEPPPTYELDETQLLPVYSSHCGSSECVLQIEAPRATGCPACDWIYETKHMKINLGPRIWGLHSPAYGLDGKIEGTISFLKDRERVESVTATLEGRIRTTLSQRNSMSGDPMLPLFAAPVTLYDASMNESFEWNQEHPFSIPIPSKSSIHGHVTPMPPSHFSFHQHITCEVFYSIKFDMVRRGHGLRKHETKNIRILYLPKSYPSEPPLTVIPRLTRQHQDASQFLHMFERVKTVTMSPFHPYGKHNTPLDAFQKCCHLSLPNPQCFTSGQPMPFTLSLVFPQEPVIAQLLTRNIRVQLLKRLLIWRKGLSEVVQRDTLVSSASLRCGKEFMEGITLLRGEIRTGEAGRERSWRIADIAEVQYVLRIMLRPPSSLVGYVPSFRHEEVLEITTDSWGTLNRELSSTGGTPTPAVGLAAKLRQNI